MRKILFIGLIFSLLCSCSNLDYTEGGDGEFGTPLSVTSASILMTRGTSTTLTNGSIGVFRLAANGYTAQNNVRYDYNSTTGAWVKNSNDIYLGNNAATICAYSPIGAAGVTATADPTKITLTSQKYDVAQDLCYARNVTGVTNALPNVSFDMLRAYAKMTFNITHPASTYSGAGVVTQIGIANAGLNSTGTLNVTNGTYGAGTTGTVSFNPSIPAIAVGQTVSTSVMLVPVTTAMSGNLTFTFTVDGAVKTMTLDALSNNLATLLPGNDYQVNVTLGYTLTESNCYIVKPGGTVYIPVSRAYKSSPVSFSSPWTAGLLWTDKSPKLSASGTVASVTANNTNSSSGYITVKAGSAEGNAVVFAKNSSGAIIWSWHIWVTNYDPDNGGTTCNYDNGASVVTFMDRNLGATTVAPAAISSQGLLYQWGRKDPFPASYSVSSGVEPTLYGSVTTVTRRQTSSSSSTVLVNTVKNPLTFYYGTSSNSYDWYSTTSSTHNNTLWGATKTVYDPCPVGWKVPSWNGTASPWEGLTTSGTWNDGYSFPSIGYYPAAGYRNYSSSGALTSVGSIGVNWSATAYNGNAYDLDIDNTNVMPHDNTQRAAGLSVRCVKE